MPFSTPYGFRRAASVLSIIAISILTGCAEQRGPASHGLTAQAAIEHYRLTRAERLDSPRRAAKWTDLLGDMTAADFAVPTADIPSFALTSYASPHRQSASTQPTPKSSAFTTRPKRPAGERPWLPSTVRETNMPAMSCSKRCLRRIDKSWSTRPTAPL